MGPQIDLRPRERYRLPHALRSAVAGNFGELVQTRHVAARLRGARTIAAVGDVVSMTLHDLGIQPRVFIVDYRSQRDDLEKKYREVLGAWGDHEVRVRNPPATITRKAWDAIRDALAADGTTRVVVEGEEDLLAIPCFLEIEEGGKVLYGAPDRGLVIVTVDAGFKELVAGIVARMERA